MAQFFRASVIATSPYTTTLRFYATKKPLFDKILIANRGEIACRVIKTARKLGIQTVAVFSDADQKSQHVKLADEAYYLGKPPAKESYLLGNKIIEIAKQSGAQAIHPGYGFLSENAEFALACAENNVVFIGPPASAIEAMGSKSASKYIMEEANVPVVPGYHGEDQSIEILTQEADRIGYPVLIKAWMGGGGKGMRIVWDKKDLEAGVESARREANSSFGDDRVLIEKYLVRPRHIEFQVFADQHGNCVYVFERDCSVQRRHQKVVEEAPAPGMTEELRQQMGQAAVNAAKAVGYVGAGTVEFIVDEDGSFYFMEMNTRLQVEHPVSEMISKQDLVEWQLEVASGNELPKKQSELKIHGHAVEARIYAENPDTFLPCTGRLDFLQTPQESENVRVDTGVLQGDQVSVYYDPMIAKLVIWDQDRTSALRRLYLALNDYKIVGLTNNISFLKKVIRHPVFKSGKIDTKFIQDHKPDLLTSTDRIPDQSLALLGVYVILKDALPSNSDPWSTLAFRRFNLGFQQEVELLWEESKIKIKVSTDTQGVYTVNVNDSTIEVSAVRLLSANDIQARLDGRIVTATVVPIGQTVTIFFDEHSYEFSLATPSYTSSAIDSGSLTSPMPGRITKVNVVPGQQVQEGDCLLIMEAMKMEHQIKASGAGVVKEIYYKVGDLVEAKKVLINVTAS